MDRGFDVGELRCEDLLEGGAAVRSEGADVPGEVGQGREVLGVGTEFRYAEQLQALFALFRGDRGGPGLRGDQ
ncbi:hypothetical protein SNARM312S_01003 [Streptomyces narbonensis]